MARPQSVLCIGGGGFLGAHIAHALSEAPDFEVSVVDLTQAKLRLRFDNRPYAFRRLDIREEAEALETLIAAHDIVLNLASVAHPRHYVEHPLDVIELNLKAGLRIIEACSTAGRRLVHFSTSEVYGKSGPDDPPFGEEETDCRLGPISRHRWIYSCAKQLLDRTIHAHGLERGLDYVILRPFNVIGPLQDHLMTGADDGCPRVLAQFLSALINGEDLRVVDGGASLRCFTDVRDVVSGVLAVLRAPGRTRQAILNVGAPDNEIAIRDLADRMRALFEEETGAPSPSRIVSVAAEDFYGEGYEDTPRRRPDIARMRALGWSPRYDLDAALRHAMAAFLRQGERMSLVALDAAG